MLEKYSLSSVQLPIWLDQSLNPSSPLYNLGGYVTIKGEIDPLLFEEAINTVLQGADALRARFTAEEGEFFQSFPRHSYYHVRYTDVSANEHGREKCIEQIGNDFFIPFSLDADRLFKFELFKVSDGLFFWYLKLHHILVDGWAVSLLTSQVSEAYERLFNETTEEQQTWSYIDFIQEDKNYLRSDEFEINRLYWVNKFKGLENELKPRRDISDRSIRKYLAVKWPLYNIINNQSKTAGVTTFHFFLGLLYAYFSKARQENDMVIGTPILNRSKASFKKTIGLFTTVSPIRVCVDQGWNFQELLLEIRKELREAFKHQKYPINQLVKDLNLRSAEELFQVSLSYEKHSYTTKFAGFDSHDTIISGNREKAFLAVYVREYQENEDVRIDFDFNCSFWDEAEMDLFIRRFDHLLRQTLVNVQAPLSSLELLPDWEKKKLLSEFNQVHPAFKVEQGVMDLLKDNAAKKPDAPAVTEKGTTLTCAELEHRTGKLAAYLRQRYNISEGDVVGVLLPRSADFIVSILSILKAGAAYLPIDTSYPPERINFMLKDSSAKLVISASAQPEAGFPQLLIDREWGQIEACTSRNAGFNLSFTSPAFISYTSGSTGNPKGVAISHGALAGYISFLMQYLEVNDTDAMLHQASVSFDIAVEEIFTALCSGIRLVIAPEGGQDIEQLWEIITDQKVSIVSTTPAVISELNKRIDSNSPLRIVISGGEELKPAHIDRLLLHTQVYNGYGPTETTVACSFNHVRSAADAGCIGYPISNVNIYVLGEDLQPVPIGEAGEICVAGPCVAEGYLNLPELTAQKFTAVPFKDHERMYRTGDLGRWSPEGKLYFLGRKDEQVKLSGYRIELGEIENALLSFENISHAAAAVRPVKGNQVLLAWFVAEGEVDLSEVRNHLRIRLPRYMVPAHLEQISRIPMLPSGKADKKNLPVPENIRSTETTIPASAEESALAAIWQSVLNIPDIGVHDNFFMLGGDSIKIIQIASRLQQAGYVMQSGDVFEYPTIAELAKRLERPGVQADQSPVTGEVLLNPIQQEFFEQVQVHPHHYNQSVMLRLKKRTNPAAIQESLKKLVEHHDMLRASFSIDEEKIVQFISTPHPRQRGSGFDNDLTGNKAFYSSENNNRQDISPTGGGGGWTSSVLIIDLANASAQDAEVITAQKIGEAQAGLDLEKGLLIRAILFRLNNEDRLFITIHHLVVDGISWRILLEDLGQLLEQNFAKSPLSLPPKTNSFQQWTGLQHQQANSPAFLEQVQYWAEVEKIPVDRIPVDPAIRSKVKDSFITSGTLSPEVTRSILSRPGASLEAGVNDILLSGLCLALSSTFGTGQHGRVCIALEGHGRELGKALDLNRTVGWFTSIYPVVLETGKDLPSLISSTRQALQGVPRKGIGYGMLKYLTNEKHKAGLEFSLRPQISFNYLGEFDQNGDVFEILHEQSGLSCHPDQEREFEIEVTAMVINRQLQLSISCAVPQFRENTIQHLLDNYCKALEEMTTQETGSAWKGNAQDMYPLSPLQEGMYFHYLLDKGSGDYIEQLSFQLHGIPDINKMGQSFQALLDRHDILRTAFRSENFDRPLQIVLKTVQGDFHYKDLRSFSATEQKAVIDAYRLEDRTRGFDLETGNLIRLAVFQLSEETLELLWTHHHIIIDGWCLSVLMGDFFSIYRTGTVAQLPPAKPYRNFISWLQQKDHAASANYWKKYVAGFERPAGIPRAALFNQPAVEKELVCRLSEELTVSLQEVAIRCQVTFNSVVQGIWSLLLARYNHTDDVLFGAVVSGRSPEVEGIESMIGLFINTIPVRVQVAPEGDFLSLLKQIQKKAVTAEEHHHYALADIQNSAVLKQGLLDHILVFENYPIGEEINRLLDTNSEGDFSVAGVQIDEQTNYDLTLILLPGKNLTLRFLYNSSVYDGAFLQSVARHFEAIALAVTQQEQIKTCEIDILSKEERLLIRQYGGLEADTAQPTSFMQLFEAAVAQHANRTAVEAGENSLSYSDLNKRANQLAAYLSRHYHIQPGDTVAVMLERSEWLPIAVLGILKAGAAYVPVDSAYPEARVSHMLQDSGVTLVITNKFHSRGLRLPKAPENKLPRLIIDKDWPAITGMDEQNLNLSFSPASPAYIIYTSGSTGTPKGVVMPHGALSNLLSWQINRQGFEPGRRCLQFSSIGFDVSFQELFSTWLTGGALVMVNEEIRRDAHELLKFISLNKIERLFLPFAALQQITEAAELAGELEYHLKEVITAGERLVINQVVSQFFRGLPGCRLYNQYGPSESHVVTEFVLDEDQDRWENLPPIGRPVANAGICILDQQMKPVPVGVEGELCITGPCLATGYLNNPELTAEKFIPNPFGEERLYKTGDIARWRRDGLIDCLGRTDAQVKIRGYRVETGEVESLLLGHRAIKEAAVVVSEDREGSRSLVACFVPHTDVEIAELRTHLRDLLPEYMVPSFFQRLDAFPLTSSGKIDRKRLPGPAQFSPATETASAELTVKEQKLADIWKSLLEVNQVKPNDNFFDLGGHSLKATRLAARIYQAFGVKITIKTIFAHPTLKELTTAIGKMSGEIYSLIPRIPEAQYYPASHAQKRLWILQKLDPDSTAYHMPASFILDGKLDMDALTKAFDILVTRHESLRTRFFEKDGEIHQLIIPFEETGFEVEYAEAYPPLAGEVRAESRTGGELIGTLLNETCKKPFDLSTDNLIRVSLSQLAADGHLLTVCLHHIISDGWSMEVLVKEFRQVYSALAQGRENPLKPLRLQYKDYAAWQHNLLAGDQVAAQREYWLKQFEDELPVLELPTDRPRPAEKTYAGRTLYFEPDQELLRQLELLGKQQGCTLFMSLLAVLHTLLHRYSGQTGLVIGTPAAGREHMELEDQIGFYVNTLPLRTQFGSEDSFLALMEKIRSTTLNGYENQLFPFDELVNALNPDRNLSRSPLFDIMFVLQDSTSRRLLEEELHGLRIEECRKDLEISKYDQVWNFEEKENRMIFSVEYNTDLFDAETIQSMGRHFISLMEAAVADPLQSVGKLDYLSAEEKDQLLYVFNNTRSPYPQQAITELFEERVRLHPAKMALADEHSAYTYDELLRKASDTADLLRENGVVPGEIVAILPERNADFVIGILGILKAGAAYLPLDKEWPEARIKGILHEAGVKVMLTDGLSMRHCEEPEGRQSNLPRTGGLLFPHSRDRNDAHSPAYVIYTSGSTGKPKGSLIPHNAVVRLVKNTNYLDFTREHRIVQTGSFAFDATTFEVWGALLNGGTVCIPLQETLLHAGRLKAYIREKQITTAFFTTAYFNSLVEADLEVFAPLENLLTGGERHSTAHLNKVKEAYPQLNFISVYGPTENTTFSTFFPIEDKQTRQVPIGKPISNTRVYILDRYKQLVPVGVTGELYLAGDGLSERYLSDPVLTRERFHQDLWGEKKIYNSGDLARWLPDGNIDFMGRADQQVKIRGYRIEPGDIEKHITDHPAVRDTVVTTYEGTERQLVAYFTAKEVLDPEQLKTFLSAALPAYMIPNWIIQLDRIPLTINGKIDKKALPLPQTGRGRSAFNAPQTSTEQALAEVWKELLGLEQPGLHDNFFESGGHSLKAIKLTAAIYKDFGVTISLKDVFTRPTLKDLAALLDEADEKAYQPIPKVTPGDNHELSHAQKRLWVLSLLEGGSAAYNIPAAFRIRGKLDAVVLAQAFTSVIERHESLRTVLIEADDLPRQKVLQPEALDFRIETIDLQDDPGAEEKIERYLHEASLFTFDLYKGPLLRVQLLQLSGDEYILVFAIHHIISDEWSLDVMVRELQQCYAAWSEGKEPVLSPLPIQYKDYAAWQNERLEHDLESQKAYWLENLQGELPILELPADKTRPAIQTFHGNSCDFDLDTTLVEELKKYGQEQGVTLFMTLLAAVNAVFYRYTGQTDIILGSPVAGREHPDLESQVGFFVNTLALRTSFEDSDSFSALTQKVKRTALGAYANQSYPFDVLVDNLGLERDLSRSALFNVMISLQNADIETKWTQGFSGLTMTPLHCRSRLSMFDMSIRFTETQAGFSGSIEYNTDLYHQETIRSLTRHLVQFMNAALKDPSVPVAEIPYLSGEEMEQLLVTFNDTTLPYPVDKGIVELFDEQVDRTPNEVAIVYDGGKTLTYRELQTRSNALAAYLQQNVSLENNDKIALLTVRSVEMIIGIMGILKAGAAYVPIEISHPADRIQYILDQAGCKALVTTEKIELPDRHIISVEETVTTDPQSFIKTNIAPDTTAYIIFTSGSTGQPKGVEIPHQAVVNLAAGLERDVYYRYQERLRIALGSSYVFDASVQQIFACLFKGHCLCIVPEDIKHSGHLLLDFLIRHQIDIADGTPAHMSMLMDTGMEELPAVKHYIIGGEALPKQVVERFYGLFAERGLELPLISNVYGPTECCVDSTHFTVYPEQLNSCDTIPIGKPMANRLAYILDSRMRPVPIGVWGELFIGGTGQAKGYINLPEQTAERFVPNPFRAGERMYKTGDVCRWLPDGNIAYLGRNDSQVKIRGYRIELGEIENVLLKHDKVKEVAVLPRKDKSGTHHLVAFIVAEEVLSTNDFLTHLKKFLPDYMHPAFFLQLEKFPLNTSGKIDRKTLLNIKDAEVKTAQSYTSPANDLEQKLVDIWQELLQKEQISTDENFFEIGGHSLIATQLVSRISKILQVKIELKDIFAHRTITSLATFIGSKQTESWNSIDRTDEREYYDLSHAQKRLWVLSQFHETNLAYNMVGAYILEGVLNTEAFTLALEAIVERHESLRTVFHVVDEEPRQKIVPAHVMDFKVAQLDLQQDSNSEQTLRDIVREMKNTSMDLSTGPLIHARLVKLTETRHAFILALHHIISDGWSSAVLEHEIKVLYNAFSRGEHNPLPALSLQYKDYAAWQVKNSFAKEEQYWMEELGRGVSLMKLPYSLHTKTPGEYNKGSIEARQINSDTTLRLRELAVKNETTLSNVVFTVFNIFLSQLTNQAEVTVGLGVANRNHADLEHIVGFFVNTLVIRTNVEEAETFEDLLQIVTKKNHKAFEHQGYPFNLLVEKLNPGRTRNIQPLVNVTYVFQNFADVKHSSNALELDGLAIHKNNYLNSEKELFSTSKFDLTLFVFDHSDHLSFMFEYDTALFTPDTVGEFAGIFERFVQMSVEKTELTSVQAE